MTEATNVIAEKEKSLEIKFSESQIELIRRTLCPKASDDELAFFIAVCKRRGLDPFANQIHAVKRWNSEAEKEILTIQTGIDGFRIIAERTGEYGGQIGPFWTADGVNWVDVWVQDEPPLAAKVGIIRKSFNEVIWGTARFNAFCARKKNGELNHMWAGMADHMIAKCAEALAFRKAFPNEFNGLYADEEMMQADNPTTPPQPKQAIRPPQQKTPIRPIAHDEIRYVREIATETGTNRETGKEWIRYDIYFEGDGKKYSTFSESLKSDAYQAWEQALGVVPVVKSEQKGKFTNWTIEHITIAPNSQRKQVEPTMEAENGKIPF